MCVAHSFSLGAQVQIGGPKPPRVRLTTYPCLSDDRPHGWITGEPPGVIDVLVSGEPPKHRLPKQSAQRVTPVLAAAAIEELGDLKPGPAPGLGHLIWR